MGWSVRNDDHQYGTEEVEHPVGANEMISRRIALPTLFVILTAVATAQPTRSSRRTNVRKQEQNAPLHYGEFTISHIVTASGEVGKYATIEGPNATVDVEDPKQPNQTMRLQAAKITVYMIPGT